MMKLSRQLYRNQDGATAVEFALYSTVFFTMLFGGIYASMLGFTSASLQSATEFAARCRAMGTTCTDSATTQTEALKHFHSVTGITPTFTTTTATCGNKVTGQVNYSLKYILGTSTIALASAACFPTQTAAAT